MYALLAFKAGQKNINLAPSAVLLRRYQAAIRELGEHEGALGSVRDQVGALRILAVKKSSNKNKGKKKKARKQKVQRAGLLIPGSGLSLLARLIGGM